MNLSNLIGDARKQNINIQFKIKEVKGSEAYAETVSYLMVAAHVKRMVRAGREKLDDSFTIETKDKEKLKIKPVIITKNKAKNSILTKIRMGVRDHFLKMGKIKNFQEILKEVIDNNAQREIKSRLSKTYPLSIIEIRELSLVNN